MAERFYTSTTLRKSGKKWCGVLQYQVPNPAYVEDTRTPEQRRKAFGKRPNPNYIEDTRTPEQKRRTITRQVSKTFDPDVVKTKTQASTALEAWRRQKEAERGTPDASLTVTEYVEQYISTLEELYDPIRTGTSESSGISPTTAHDYRGTMRYFKRGEAISSVMLRSLTTSAVQKWELSLLREGLNGTTVAKAHRLLWSVCENAVNQDVLPKNPARGVKTPHRTSGNRPNALDAEGRAKAMIAFDSVETTPLTIAARLALYCGLRRGECCGLTWGNVDLEGVAWLDESGNEMGEKGPKIRIARAIGECKGGTYTKPPKSAAGRRVLALKGGIVDVLREHRTRMWDEWSTAMSKAGIEPTEQAFNELYVCGHIDGTYYTPAVLTHEWSSFARQHGLMGTERRYVTFHGLRDTYATAASTRHGASGEVIANNLGHSDPLLTMRKYSSGRDAAAQAAANETVAADLDAARTGEVLPFVPRTGTEG